MSKVLSYQELGKCPSEKGNFPDSDSLSRSSVIERATFFCQKLRYMT